MQIAPIDLTAIIAVVMGISVVLVPVIGLTARFVLKPTVEALSQFFDSRGLDDTVAILERRMALMETQMDSLDSSMKRLADVGEFHMALSAGDAPKADEASAPSPAPAPAPEAESTS